MNDLKGIIEDCNKSDLVSDRVIKKAIEIIGQEEWQILHDENNDVCTTIGELIITLKEVAELEEQLVISEHDREHNDYELTEVYKKVEVLEKENAELRKKCYKKAVKDYCKVETQLTKAKELLKRFIELENCTLDYEDIKEAEQFLSEV